MPAGEGAGGLGVYQRHPNHHAALRGRACDDLCDPPTPVTVDGACNASQPGTGAVSVETTSQVNAGNCRNFVAPRVLQVKGSTMPCKNLNGASIPAPRNGGHCIQAAPGDDASAYLFVW